MDASLRAGHNLSTFVQFPQKVHIPFYLKFTKATSYRGNLTCVYITVLKPWFCRYTTERPDQMFSEGDYKSQDQKSGDLRTKGPEDQGPEDVTCST